MARAGRRRRVPARLGRVSAARAAAQPGAAGPVRLRSAAAAGSAEAVAVGERRGGGGSAPPVRDGAPESWAFSRFLAGVAKLEDETGAVSWRTLWMDELPGFGRHLGYDGKAVGSHSTGREDAKSGKTSDPDADWGKHETRGADRRTGRAWTKVKTWFGYGLHLIADRARDSGRRSSRKSRLGPRHGPRRQGSVLLRALAKDGGGNVCTARRVRCSAAARRRGRSGRWRSRASRRTGGR